MATRTALHEMIEWLPDDALDAAERALNGVTGTPVSLKATLDEAPFDDEPLTEDDIAAIDAGWRSLREGRGINDEDLDERLAAS